VESHWLTDCYLYTQHPGRNVRQHEVVDDEGNTKHVHPFGSREYWRAQLVLRPLEWVRSARLNSPARLMRAHTRE